MLTVAFMAASCAKDDLGVPTNSEGHPVRVTLNMGMGKSTDIVVTRADNSYSDLGNLYLFVYGSDGKYQQMLSTTATDSNNRITVETRSENDNGVTYTITINTTSGTKNLLAVANTSAVADEGGFWSSMASIAKDAAAGDLSFKELKAAVISLRKDLYERTEMLPIQIVSSTQMLISGVNEGVVFGTNGNITKYGQLDGTDKVVVKMDRAMARITFNIAQTVEGAKGTFVPSSYRVYNIPTESVLTNTNKSNTKSDNTYINSAPMTIGNVSGGNYTFSFYMPENIPVANENASIASYQDRDKWSGDKGSRPENKKWTNAPQNSTFVVISGTYSQSGDTTDKNNSYTGNVSYTIHLGDFSNDAWSNFNVERNCSYTYKMSVMGVDNIVVEAEKEGNEQQPGAEGQIFTYDASTYSYELDAHYEQVFLEYNLSTIAKAIRTKLGKYNQTQSDKAIDNAIADNLILVIQSEAMDYTHATATDDKPYTVQNKRGTLSPYRIYANAVRNAADPAVDKENVLAGEGENLSPTKGFDYKWVEFWPQTGTNIAAYPGVSKWSREDLRGFSNEGAYGGTATTESEHLKDVYDVIVAMGKVVKKIYKGENVSTAEDGIIVTQSNNGYVARFTAFVNEYYYYCHPLTKAKVTSWSVITNKIPREMIIAMSSSISQDGNSSYSQIYSYITQASIQTFYNSRVSDINGFGIETYNETPHITFGKEGLNGLSKTDGRSNQITLIGGLSPNSPNWNDFIESSYNGWTKSVGSDRTTHKLSEAAYKTSSGGSGAYYACLSRNRDLNGNGVIDNNEIRWYLPSLNEYIRIGVGSNAISNAAQLYMGDKMNMKRPTYSWSYDDGYPINYIWDGALYYTSSNDDERVYWAVERGSYSKDGENWGGGFAAKPIRCIRSLPANTGGFDISSVHVASDASYVAHNVNGSTVLEFKGRLVDELYRERTDGVLIPHDEDDNANSYYDGIIVAKNYLGTTYKLNTIINSGDTDNPCRDYHERGDNGATWRVPNLAELSAMNAAGLITQKGTACRTQFSNQNVRFGYGFNESYIYCFGDKDDEENLDSDFPIRCVRDVPEGYVFPQ